MESLIPQYIFFIILQPGKEKKNRLVQSHRDAISNICPAHVTKGHQPHVCVTHYTLNTQKILIKFNLGQYTSH